MMMKLCWSLFHHYYKNKNHKNKSRFKSSLVQMNNQYSNAPLLLELTSVLLLILVFFIGGAQLQLLNISDSCLKLQNNQVEKLKRIAPLAEKIGKETYQIDLDFKEAVDEAGGNTPEIGCTYFLKRLSASQMSFCPMMPECSTEELSQLFNITGLFELYKEKNAAMVIDVDACKDRFEKELVPNFSCGMATWLLIVIIVGVIVLILVIGGVVLCLVLGGRSGGGENQNQYNPEYPGYNPQAAAPIGGKAQLGQGSGGDPSGSGSKGKTGAVAPPPPPLAGGVKQKSKSKSKNKAKSNVKANANAKMGDHSKTPSSSANKTSSATTTTATTGQTPAGSPAPKH